MAKYEIVKGATSQRALLFIQDSASTTGGGKTGLAYNTASLTAYYVRPGAAAAAITLATQTVTGSYSSGGFVEIDATNMPGWYLFDIPNACLTTGANSVGIHFKGAAGMVPLPLEIELTATNNQDNIRGGLTALPNIAMGNTGCLLTASSGTGGVNTSSGMIDANVRAWNNAFTATVDTNGYPVVTIKNGTGAGELSITGGVVSANAVQISGDSTAADNCELFFDGTGYNASLSAIGAVGTVSATIPVNVTQIGSSSAASNNFKAFFDGTGYNAANSAVGTIATVTNMVAANVVQISGDAAAADNCESWFDGTGYAATASAVGTVATVTNMVTANVTQISGDATAADNCELFFDGTGYDASTSAIGTVAAVTAVNDKAGYSLSAGGVDAIWDEALAGHATAGSAGAALSAAGSVTDPWSVNVPGAYTSGQAGYILGTFLDAAISDVPAAVWSEGARTVTGGTVDTITNPVAVSGTVSADVVQISGDAAAADSLEALLDGTGGVTLSGSLSGSVGSVVGGVTVATNGDKTGYALTSGERGSIADAVWDEPRTGHTTGGTFGLYLDAQVSAVAAAVWAVGARTVTGGTVASVSGAVGSVTSPVTAGTVTDKTGYALSASGVDAIWDEALAGHAGAGTAGAALSAAGSGVITPQQVWEYPARAVTDKDGFALSAAGTAAVADRLLGRHIEGGSDGGRTVAQALQALRNKWSRTASALTVYNAAGSVSWQSSLVEQSGHNSVVTSTPTD